MNVSAVEQNVQAIPDVRKYDFIDAIRGYAVLAVLLVHSAMFARPANGQTFRLLSQGTHGVQLFYIASAITLCMSFDFRRKHELSPIRNYFIRRFFRIAPLFYCSMVLYLAIYGFSPRYAAPDGISWWYIPITACFVNGILPETINSIVPGEWSIAVEMTFYLLLPIILAYSRTMKATLLLLVVAILLDVIEKYACDALFLAHYDSEHEYLVRDFEYYNIFGQLPVFACGILAYRMIKDEAAMRKSMTIASLAVALALACYVSFPAMRMVLGNQIIYGFFFMLFAVVLSKYPRRLLVNRVMVATGKVSYGMYLLQFAILEALVKVWPSRFFGNADVSCAAFFMTMALLTYVVSYWVSKTVEKGGIQIGSMIIKRLEDGKRSRL